MYIDPTGEIFEYSGEDAEKNLEKYRRHLEKCGKKCENELNILNRLAKSDVTYVINLKAGKDQSATGEGELTSDGSKIFVNIDNVGGPSGEKYSLNARFAHELEHARQFEDGELSFFKTEDGKWVATNYDLTDEVNAHSAMLGPGSSADQLVRDNFGNISKSTLGNFASAKTEEDRLEVIRGSSYGKKGIADTPKNFQPAPSVSGGKKAGELVRTDRYFGRIYATKAIKY